MNWALNTEIEYTRDKIQYIMTNLSYCTNIKFALINYKTLKICAEFGDKLKQMTMECENIRQAKEFMNVMTIISQYDMKAMGCNND